MFLWLRMYNSQMNKNKNVVISIHQPGYHRYLGYYKKIISSDVFIDFNTVQYVSREWQNRQKFIHNSKEIWLSTPVERGRDIITKKIIIDNGWRKSHFFILQDIYKKSSFWFEHKDFLKEFYYKKHTHLDKMCNEMNSYVLSFLDIKTQMYVASEFESEQTYQYKKGRLLAQLIEDLKVIKPELKDSKITYLSGTGAESYMNSVDITGKKQVDYFQDNKIEVKYQKFTPIQYSQTHSVNNFIPYLSIFDAILNVGKEETIRLLK